MLRDVLAALKRVRRLSRITIVCADRDVTKTAKKFHVDFVWEGPRRGLNKGLRLAIRKTQQNGAAAVLVVHADIPLIKPREVDRLLKIGQNYHVAIVPSKDGIGTNALLLKPPSVIRPAFGRGSFQRHLQLAERDKLRYRVLKLPSISFDVDEPTDLRTLRRHLTPSETYQFLTTTALSHTGSQREP